MEVLLDTLKIKGIKEDAYYCFRGIPYGKAERFMPPVKASWKDVLDCTTFSDRAPQLRHGEFTGSEDCLNLNVYTKDLKGNQPVFVYIHGGAFQNGSNQGLSPVDVIKQDDFVLVTVNYRVGILGFLYQEVYPTSGNNGILDMMLAIRWIHDNIQYFGGNPNQITVGGESAGAKSIGALMATDVNELFQQVLLCSGANQSVRSIDTAKKVAQMCAKICDLADLKTMPLEKLIDVQSQLCIGSSTCMFGPVSDGIVISKDYYEFDHYFTGKAMITSCLNELGYYPMMDKEFLDHTEAIAKQLFGVNVEYAKSEALRLGNDVNAWVKVLSDGMYRTYSYRLAKFLKQRGQEVYVTSCTYLPALHVQDFQLAFSPNAIIKMMDNKEEALALGAQIRSTFVDFIMGKTINIPTDKQLTFGKEVKLEDLDEAYCDAFPKAIYVL